MAKKKKGKRKRRGACIGILSTLSYFSALNQVTGGMVHKMLPPGAFEGALRSIEWSLWKPIWSGMGVEDSRAQGILTAIATKGGKTMLNKANLNPKLIGIPGTITIKFF